MKKLLFLVGLFLSFNAYSMQVFVKSDASTGSQTNSPVANPTACECGSVARYINAPQNDGLACDTYLKCTCANQHCTVQYRWSQSSCEFRAKKKKDLCDLCLAAIRLFEDYENEIDEDGSGTDIAEVD